MAVFYSIWEFCCRVLFNLCSTIGPDCGRSLGNKILVSIKIVYISLKLNRFQCEQCGEEMVPEYYKEIHGQEYRLQDFQ